MKLTNTLVVVNPGDFMPGEEAYLSGEPLHVLALTLGSRLREKLGAAFPVSFSAGIDSANVAGAVASGFVPVTSCTDLLRPGGYERLHRQAEALAGAVHESGTAAIPDFIRARAGAAAGGDVAAASLAEPPPCGCRGARRRALYSRENRPAAPQDRFAPSPSGLHQL